VFASTRNGAKMAIRKMRTRMRKPMTVVGECAACLIVSDARR
jgi:hypothetical protein